MKTKIIILILVIIILIAAVLFYFKNGFDLNHDGLTVPSYIELNLSKSNNQPYLRLSAVIGGGCKSGPLLQTEVSYNNKDLIVIIKGHESFKSEGPCAAISTSDAKINLDQDWLDQPGDKNIIFKSRSYDNLYVLSHFEDRYYLKPINTHNVISNHWGNNPPEKAQEIGI